MRKPNLTKRAGDALHIVPLTVEHLTERERYLVALFRRVSDICQDMIIGSMERHAESSLLKRTPPKPTLRLVERSGA